MLFQVPLQLFHQGLSAWRRAEVIVASNMKYPPLIHCPKFILSRVVDSKIYIQQGIRKGIPDRKESRVRSLTDQQFGLGQSGIRIQHKPAEPGPQNSGRQRPETIAPKLHCIFRQLWCLSCRLLLAVSDPHTDVLKCVVRLLLTS
jgi:hypothetical protein